MRSWLDSTPPPFTSPPFTSPPFTSPPFTSPPISTPPLSTPPLATPSPSTPSPPSYTNSDHINGKYNDHQDYEFNGGYVDIRMQKGANFFTEQGDIEKIHKDGPWIAALDLRFKDLAAAMKQGLYWSQDNVDPNGSCFYDNLQSIPPPLRGWWPLLQDWGFTHARRFQLIDLAEDAQWKGTLFIFSRGIKPLCRFRIHHISVNNIYCTAAYTADDKKAYEYDRAEPERNFNAIYDDMPLRGWWPWPKNSNVSDGQETSLLTRFKTILEGRGY